MHWQHQMIKVIYSKLISSIAYNLLPPDHKHSQKCKILQNDWVFTRLLNPAEDPAVRLVIMPWHIHFLTHFMPLGLILIHLLLRKKNRHYSIYKKFEIECKNILNNPHPNQQIVTRLLNKRNKAFKKSRQSANESSKANRRAKNAYSNTVNTLLMNPSVSAKKKFGILLKLMKNHKFATTPPLWRWKYNHRFQG